MKNERSEGIGGSDIAPILNLGEYRNAYDVFIQKTNPNPVPLNEFMRWGHILEPAIIRRWEQDTGQKAEKKGAFFRKAWAQAHIDALCVDAKVTSGFNFSEKFGEDYTDEIPLDYYYQGIWYMIVARLTGLDVNYWDFAVMVDRFSFRSKIEPFKLEQKNNGDWYFNERNDKSLKRFTDMIVAASEIHYFRINWQNDVANRTFEHAKKFWKNNVLKNIPPKIVQVKRIEYEYENSLKPKKEVTDEPELKRLVNLYSQFSFYKKVIDKNIEKLTGNLKEKIKDFEGVYGDDWSISFKNPKEKMSKKIKWEMVVKEALKNPALSPELTKLINKYTEERENKRKLYPYFRKIYPKIEEYLLKNHAQIDFSLLLKNLEESDEPEPKKLEDEK